MNKMNNQTICLEVKNMMYFGTYGYKIIIYYVYCHVINYQSNFFSLEDHHHSIRT